MANTSSVLITTLFCPMRVGLKDFIDAAFSHNVEKTLAQFGVGLREDLELEGLTRNLIGVIEETVQPEHISVWMRPKH